MTSITLNGVGKAFGDHEILRALDLHVAQGEFVVVVGPSGCGKSTLLRLVAGLETPSRGRILIGGDDVTGRPAGQRRLAMVFQSYALYPHMDVAANIGFPLRMAKVARAEIEVRVKAVAATLDLTQLLARRPAELSGGQRQRVAIGRALVREPVAFLFDEPLSNLDAALRGAMRTEIRRLQRALGATTIYVTHDQVEAMTMADRILVLNEGAVEQVGAPVELYRRPATRFVATFLGSPRMNVLEGGFAAAWPGAAAVGVRPEHLRLDTAGPWRGRVLAVEHLGGDSFVHVDVGEGATVCARVASDLVLAPDDVVDLAPEPGHLHAFDAAGRRLELDGRLMNS